MFLLYMIEIIYLTVCVLFLMIMRHKLIIVSKMQLEIIIQKNGMH